MAFIERDIIIVCVCVLDESFTDLISLKLLCKFELQLWSMFYVYPFKLNIINAIFPLILLHIKLCGILKVFIFQEHPI